jgi:hypothetical protein
MKKVIIELIGLSTTIPQERGFADDARTLGDYRKSGYSPNANARYYCCLMVKLTPQNRGPRRISLLDV